MSNLVTTVKAAGLPTAGRSKADVLGEFGGGQFSSFKNSLVELCVAKLSPIAYQLQGNPLTGTIFTATVQRLSQAINGQLTCAPNAASVRQNRPLGSHRRVRRAPQMRPSCPPFPVPSTWPVFDSRRTSGLS